MELYKILREYGLKEKQAKVYLACLQVGSGSVLKISERAELARSTTELILKSLQQEGLISAFKKKNISHYNAEDPSKIIMSLKEKSELIERALPEFLALYGSNRPRPVVRFYIGKAGMRIILKEILNEAKELLSFGSADDLFTTLEDFHEFVKNRVRLKIPIKVILCNSDLAHERKRLGGQEFRQVKIISSEYGHHGLIYIWADKIAMFSLKNELNAVLIESRELAQVQKSLFLSLWDRY